MNKGFALIIPVILIALASTAGIVFINQLRHSNNQSTALPTIPGATIIPSASSNPSPSQTPLPTSTQQPIVISSVLNVADISSNPESYAGKRVKVRGKLVLHTYEGAGPCPATKPNCSTEMKPPTLHLVNPASPWEGVIDLYRKSGSGYTQISCESSNNSTCGQYQLNTEITLEGLFTKEQVPYQQVETSTGKIETIKYQDHFLLVVN